VIMLDYRSRIRGILTTLVCAFIVGNTAYAQEQPNGSGGANTGRGGFVNIAVQLNNAVGTAAAKSDESGVTAAIHLNGVPSGSSAGSGGGSGWPQRISKART
jgi:hypothetical protein